MQSHKRATEVIGQNTAEGLKVGLISSLTQSANTKEEINLLLQSLKMMPKREKFLSFLMPYDTSRKLQMVCVL